MRALLVVTAAVLLVGGGALAARNFLTPKPGQIPQTGNATRDTNPVFRLHALGDWSGTSPDVRLVRVWSSSNTTMLHLETANVSSAGAVVNGVQVNSSGPVDVPMHGGPFQPDAQGNVHVPVYIGRGFSSFATWAIPEADMPLT